MHVNNIILLYKLDILYYQYTPIDYMRKQIHQRDTDNNIYKQLATVFENSTYYTCLFYLLLMFILKEQNEFDVSVNIP